MRNSDCICNFPECTNRVESRGLCQAHIAQVRNMLRTGDAEEEDLIKRGLLLERKTAGRSFNSARAIFTKGSEVQGSPTPLPKETP